MISIVRAAMIFMYLLAPCLAQGEDRPLADINLAMRAMTDTGIPVNDMPILLAVGVNWKPNAGMLGSMDTKYVRGKTDALGNWKARTGLTITPDASIFHPTVEGYYDTRSGCAGANMKIENGDWLPSPRVATFLFRHIQHPVPMYIRQVMIVFPAGDGPFGYDLIAHDLIAPWGKGIVPHLIFSMERAQTSKRPVKDGMYQYKHYDPTLIEAQDSIVDETLIIGTAAGADRGMLMAKMPETPETPETPGIILESRSRFMWPYEAPATGFVPNLRFRSGPGSDGRSLPNGRDGYADKRPCFAFVTSDATGRPLVGRISGGIDFGPPSCVAFTYHLNPDPNSRSLEWSENLFDPEKKQDRYQQQTGTIPEPEAPAKKAPASDTGFVFGPMPR